MHASTTCRVSSKWISRRTLPPASVHIWGPEPINLADRAKKLLDGFLSALHHCTVTDGDLGEIFARLEARYGWNRDEMMALLVERANAVLGQRRVPRVHVRADPRSVMWSPDDHRLAGGELRHELTAAGSWKIKARLTR